MNGNIVSLVVEEKPVSEDVVKLVKEFLQLAEAGKLRSVAIIGSVPDGVQYACSVDDVPSALGCLELLKQEILKSNDQG